MSKTLFGPQTPEISRAFGKIAFTAAICLGRVNNYFCIDDKIPMIAALKKKVDSGRPVTILGYNPVFHNTNMAVVRVEKNKAELVFDFAEEDFSGIKNDPGFPENCLELISSKLGKTHIDAIATGWDYIHAAAFAAKSATEHLPGSISTIIPRMAPEANLQKILQGFQYLAKCRKAMGLPNDFPIVASPHHDNHASTYHISPFRNIANVMVAISDGYGDCSSISLYKSDKGCRLMKIYSNDSLFDSLGVMYSVLGCGITGVRRLSCESIIMELSRFGNSNRSDIAGRKANRYYAMLNSSELIRYCEDGSIKINRMLINVCRGGVIKPWTSRLIEILGQPYTENMLKPGNKDFIGQKRRSGTGFADLADKASAVQMIFEDAIVHLIGNLIRTARSDKLVMSGGSAYNSLAIKKLAKMFDAKWYLKNKIPGKGLKTWVPQFPGDRGISAGAALNLAVWLMGKKPA